MSSYEYIVSACLAGINCRYDGRNTLDPDAAKLVAEGRALPVCPELLGGLPAPRESSEIVRTPEGSKKVMTASGEDVSEAFIKGARATLEICRTCGITKAILQQRSPSCGCGTVYDGSFSGKTIEGMGVTASLLSSAGIEILS